MFWKSEAEIREIVRDEIKKTLAKETDFRFKRLYDDKGDLVGTEYTFREEEGHTVHYLTQGNSGTPDFFVAHSRTQDNYENLRKDGLDVESVDIQYNTTNVFKQGTLIPPGFQLNQSGFLVPQ